MAKASRPRYSNDDASLRNDYIPRRFTEHPFDELEDEIIERESWTEEEDFRRLSQFTDSLTSEAQIDLRLDHYEVRYSEDDPTVIIDLNNGQEMTDQQHYDFQNRQDVHQHISLRRIVSKGQTQMKASTQNAKSWVSLKQGFHTFTITEAKEFLGRQADPETGEIGYIVALTYVDKETQQRVTQNYSLQKPTFLREVLLAVNDGNEEAADFNLDNIDWGTSDAETVMDIEVRAYVTQGTYMGRPTNGIGQVLPMGHPEAN